MVGRLSWRNAVRVIVYWTCGRRDDEGRRVSARASECELRSREVHDLEVKQLFLELAQQWRHMAAQWAELLAERGR
jgi:hypothetical protein